MIRTHVQRSIRERSICSFAAMPVMKAPLPVVEVGQHQWHGELVGSAAHALHRNDDLRPLDVSEAFAEVDALVDATMANSQHALMLAHALATKGCNMVWVEPVQERTLPRVAHPIRAYCLIKAHMPVAASAEPVPVRCSLMRNLQQIASCLESTRGISSPFQDS